MALFARAPQPPEHQLYGILDDADLRTQLTRPTSEFETLGRYPSFHPPAGASSSSGVVGSHTTGGEPSSSSYLSPASAAAAGGHSSSSRSQSEYSKRSPRIQPALEPSQEDVAQVSADLTGQSWFNPQAESWKPKKTTSNKMRKSPPTRPAPSIPQQQQPPVMYGYASPVAPVQGQPLTGILIKEPNQPFVKTKGPPRKSAMKTPGQQTVPLAAMVVNTVPYAPPVTAAPYPTQTPRQPAGILSPPSTVTNLSVNPSPNNYTTSWISAPPSSAGRRSAANSHYAGSSTGTSSVAFTTTSSSYYSSSAPRSARGDHHPRIPLEDDSPIEPSGPRQTLFVVNGDPADSSGSEKSPVLDTKKGFVPTLPTIQSYGSSNNGYYSSGKPAIGGSSSNSRRKHKLSDAAHMPPVPPLPPQFQAPPPPDYPPPAPHTSAPPPTAGGYHHQRAKSDLDSNPRSGRDRDRSSATKRSRAEGHSQPPPSTAANPIPFPAGSKYSSSSRHGHSHRHHSGASSSSSGDDEVSSSSSSQPRYDSSKKQQPVVPPSGVSSSSSEIPPEWMYPLHLTLEELFRGGKQTYRITTRLLSGEPKIQEVEIDVKPGWKAGTRIIFPDAGNERTPGVFQTMIFVVEQVHHERFSRMEGGKLLCNQDIELVEALKENGRREVRKVVGVDGKVIEFYPPKGVIKHGQETVVKGEGMYTRSKSKVTGRGDLIIRWNIKFPDAVTPDQMHRMRDIFKHH